MRAVRFWLVPVLAAFAGAAAAQPLPPGDPAPTPAGNKPLVAPKDKVVCESVRPTGSRMSKRQCRTVSEIEGAREANQRKLDNMGERATRARDGMGSFGGGAGPK